MRSNAAVEPVAPVADANLGPRGQAERLEIGARLRRRAGAEVDADAARGGKFAAAARASSAPEPTPKSTMRRASPRRAAKAASAASTIVSVSGRGSSTSGEIAKLRPQNSRRPTMRDSGSPAARRAA